MVTQNGLNQELLDFLLEIGESRATFSLNELERAHSTVLALLGYTTCPDGQHLELSPKGRAWVNWARACRGWGKDPLNDPEQR
jgi:hypothetical protein